MNYKKLNIKIRTTEKIINGEVAWYHNKWKNLLLKIKNFFFKPKYLKSLNNVKPINPNFLGKVIKDET